MSNESNQNPAKAWWEALSPEEKVNIKNRLLPQVKMDVEELNDFSILYLYRNREGADAACKKVLIEIDFSMSMTYINIKNESEVPPEVILGALEILKYKLLKNIQ